MKKRPPLEETFIGQLMKLANKPVKKQKLNDIQLPDGQLTSSLAQSDSNQMPWEKGPVKDYKKALSPRDRMGGSNPSS